MTPALSKRHAAAQPIEGIRRMSDRIFIGAFVLSLGLHLIMLLSRLSTVSWLSVAPQQEAPTPLEVVYEHQEVEEELRALKTTLARLKREEALASFGADTGTAHLQARIPSRSLFNPLSDPSAALPHRPAMVDLTNLVDAARGDPVLLSYFSAIRERIQHAASRRKWLSGEQNQGLVHITFLLHADGKVDQTAAAHDRPATPPLLQDVAVRIIAAAAPFPPFPPSMGESSKTIVVPIEFLLEP